MKSESLRLGGAVALVGLVVLAWALRDRFDTTALEVWVQGAGWAGPAVFVAVYAAATVLFVPGAALTLTGGALFGPVWGTVWNLTGATLGATLAFLSARYLAADWVARRAGLRLGSLTDGVSAESWRFIAFVRLVPLFPFNLLNYALGLTRIPLLTYVVASALFMLPGAVAYTWLGHVGREAFTGADGIVPKLLIALAMVATMLFIPRLVRRLRKVPKMSVADLKASLANGEQILLVDVRPANDFCGELGHIHGAQSMPLETLPSQLSEMPPDRPIRLICRTDRRSSQAKDLLDRAGFTDVRVVQGGMTAWHERGWAVEEVAATPR
jgi:uncharacterized membrane protein YdjX (TVP38/TMEM64 family)/rhodanese-related sulfurtransferase